ncbi:T9SS C-terminal target domain-containing protein [Olleya aquimaris]|nr:T9SS C-terminal target domain-containing protein [Olleya aquimaris]
MTKNYIISTCFILFSMFCATAQIINKGILKIESSTDVYFENEYTNDNSASHVSDGELYLNSNFINNGSTAASDGTTFFKSVDNPLLSISGTTETVNFNNLQVDITATNTKGVSVTDGFAINVENNVNLVSGDVRLVGESQLIQAHTGLDANTISNGKIMVDQQGQASAFKYNFWSSPVNSSGTFTIAGNKFDGTDSAINSFTPQPVLFNSGAPYNGLPSVVDGSDNVTTALTINTRWLYQYAQGSSGYADWAVINQNTPLNPGIGYTMKGTNTVDATQNYVYYGVPNNGEYATPINAGEESLVGNPYPSALDVAQFINDNITVFDALYYWVDGGSTSHYLSDYLGGYAIRNITGGTPPSVASPLISGVGTAGSITTPPPYVPVGQGFFIRATGTGNIQFNNGQRIFRTESSGDAVHYRTDQAAAENTSSNQYIRLGYEDPEGFHRQLLLGFLPNQLADITHNPGYDALMKVNRADELYFIIDGQTDNKYAIQGVDAFDDSFEFPLGLLISESGTHQIMIDEVENFQNTIYIKDNILNTTHDITDSNFLINLPIGEYYDRYSVVFTPAETLSVNEDEIKNIKIYYNPNKTIVLNNLDNIQLKNIQVFNVLGQKILQLNSNINHSTKIEIPFNQTDGVYFVKVETETGEISQKILTH